MNQTIASVLSPGITSRLRPSRWLISGYVRVYLHGLPQWVFINAYGSLDDLYDIAGFEGIEHFPGNGEQALCQRLAATFEDLLPFGATHWEADLQTATQPATIRCLWATAADVFDYFTLDKKLPSGAKLDYLRIILGFFNHGPTACLNGLTLSSLSSARAQRVVAEMDRYFHRRHLRGRRHLC